MSKGGLLAARLFGKGLPRFAGQAEAELALYARRDQLLRMLANRSQRSADFTYDLSPESLWRMYVRYAKPSTSKP